MRHHSQQEGQMAKQFTKLTDEQLQTMHDDLQEQFDYASRMAQAFRKSRVMA